MTNKNKAISNINTVMKVIFKKTKKKKHLLDG